MGGVFNQIEWSMDAINDFISYMYDYLQYKCPRKYSFMLLVDNEEYTNLAKKNPFTKFYDKGKSVREKISEIIYDEVSIDILENSKAAKSVKLILKLFFYNSIYNSVWDTIFFDFWDDIVLFIHRNVELPAETMSVLSDLLKIIETGSTGNYGSFRHLRLASQELRKDKEYYIKRMRTGLYKMLKHDYMIDYHIRKVREHGAVWLTIGFMKIIDRVFMYPRIMYNEPKAALAPLIASWRDFGLRDEKTSLLDYPNNF